MTLHPATLLLAWTGLLLLFQSWPPMHLGLAAGAFGAAAWLTAGRRTLSLLRRTRWLFLSLALLFTFSTPGERLPGVAGDVGVTVDGMLLAVEHVLRLLLLLLTLALLHERLGTAGLVAGLHWLLAPISGWQSLREKIVVRLMLVLRFIEDGPGSAGWRSWLDESLPGPDSVALKVAAIGWPDRLALAALLALATAWGGSA